MKKKVTIILFVILLVTGIIYLFYPKDRQEDISQTEIIPEEEISEEQERKTMVSVYFEDKNTGELTKENQMVDVKVLASNPYKTLLEILITGPKDENLKKAIPEGVKINGAYMNGNTVYVDLSAEFIDNHENGLEKESATIYSIVNTLTELNEVTFVKILIDGKENLEFKDGNINFKENFERND